MCRARFLFEKAEELGYNHNSDFLDGNIDGKPLMVSWRGNKNFTWDKIFDLLYEDNDEPVYRHYDISKNEYHEINNSNFTKVNLLPLEKCTKIENISNLNRWEVKSWGKYFPK